MTGRTGKQGRTVQWIWFQVIVLPLGLLEFILAVCFIYLFYKHSEGDRVGLIISVILLLLVVVVFVTLMVDSCWSYYKRRKEKSEMLQNAEVIPLQEPDTNNEAVVIPEVQKPQTQDSASPVSTETSKGTVILEVPEPQTQDSAPPVSTETSKEIEGPQTQDPTPVGSSDTSDETEKPSEISETSDQDPTSHASKETENSAVVSSGQETVGQEPPVDEQAAEDPRDDDQS